MVKLENIKEYRHFVEVDCYIDGDRTKHFNLLINTQKEKIVACNTCLKDIEFYTGHVAQYLLGKIDAGEVLPEEDVVAWF